jgi:hypothetical protein
MTTIVEFRLARKEADAARARPTAIASRADPADHAGPRDAEIILLPLTWLKQIGRSQARKPLKRRFALRELAPA